MMKTPTKNTPKVLHTLPGLPVRSDLRAGAWKCSSCEGKVMGNQLFKPNCDYCYQA